MPTRYPSAGRTPGTRMGSGEGTYPAHSTANRNDAKHASGDDDDDDDDGVTTREASWSGMQCHRMVFARALHALSLSLETHKGTKRHVHMVVYTAGRWWGEASRNSVE